MEHSTYQGYDSPINGSHSPMPSSQHNVDYSGSPQDYSRPSTELRSNKLSSAPGHISAYQQPRDLPIQHNDHPPSGIDQKEVVEQMSNTQISPPRQRAQRNDGGRPRNGSTATTRLCYKCGEPLTGQFVRALGGTYHLDCFVCHDCGVIVASKFFPHDSDDGASQMPLCEIDYFRRLNLLCFECGGALRGSYITALNRKYHIEHFTCCVCPAVFGSQDSYYEHDGRVYCHYHYSTEFAEKCSGCQTAILKQFVEIYRQGQNQHWHPECYMIHKFWNVRLATDKAATVGEPTAGPDVSDELRALVRNDEEQMEQKVYRIWNTLSSFEESSASCISDMLLHVSNGAFVDGVLTAKRFIWHVDILFQAMDHLDANMQLVGHRGLSYNREAKLLCKKIVAFFSMLSKNKGTGVRRLGVTQELLALVTGLAHYLKLLIRITLQGALKLEREYHEPNGLNDFLDTIGSFTTDEAQDVIEDTHSLQWAHEQSDLCMVCRQSVEDECAQLESKRWHLKCMSCSRCRRELGQSIGQARFNARDGHLICVDCAEGMSDISGPLSRATKLEQYIFLLRLALARLLSILRSSGGLPHTSDDPNLDDYDSSDGHRIPKSNLNPPLLSPEARSKSYGGLPDQQHGGSSYEDTLSNVRRLRSTRMDKEVSNAMHRPRQSRILDGPEAESVRPGSAGNASRNISGQGNGGFRIVEDEQPDGVKTTELAFGRQDTLTLDDIPRIVAAEQMKEQRPNAYKHQRIQQPSQPTARLVSGLQFSGSDSQATGAPSIGPDLPVQRPKKYFSELSALEYFIVRHVAVLSMQPLLEGHFNLEELLELIESRKPTFWGRFGKGFKKEPKKTGKKKGVFGVGLDVLVEKDHAECTFGVGPGALRVPALLDDAVSAMRGMDMSVEGVFRKNGNIRRLKELSEAIDARGGSSAVDLTKENVVQVAALLKKFLRELPDPLMTFKLQRLFIASQKIPDPEKRLRILHLTCCLLPKTHRDSIEILFSFLQWVASFSQVDEETGSKMDSHNLATVITPNILYANSKVAGMDESFLAIEAVHSLLEYNESMCEVPADLQSILNDSSLFNNSSEITTKEILKRYGDIGRSPIHRTGPYATDSPPRSKDGGPIALRVDSDPSQAHAWQKQSSAWQGQGQNGHSTPNLTPVSGHATPTGPGAGPFARSPYMHQRIGSAESQGSRGSQRPVRVPPVHDVHISGSLI